MGLKYLCKKCLNIKKGEEDMKVISLIAMILVLIGGLNWGLIGLFDLNLVAILFGTAILAQLIYILVGVSALWLIVTSFSKTNTL